MERIASFCIDHDVLVPGMYISRVDGDVVTYDIRFKRPNGGDYLSDGAMHTIEHLFATYARNSAVASQVIYVGPMGCRTGFYLLVREREPEEVYSVILETLRRIVSHTGEVFGASRKECGNWRELSLDSAIRECEQYLGVLPEDKRDFSYPAGSQA